jgi:hypothetical protein
LLVAGDVLGPDEVVLLRGAAALIAVAPVRRLLPQIPTQPFLAAVFNALPKFFMTSDMALPIPPFVFFALASETGRFWIPRLPDRLPLPLLCFDFLGPPW